MQELRALCQFFSSDPAERESGQELNAANAAHESGTIGAVVYHLRSCESPQMRLELERFATDENAVVGTRYLFDIAGRLAAQGHTIDFVAFCGELHNPGVSASISRPIRRARMNRIAATRGV
jgi:hypothetical protein